MITKNIYFFKKMVGEIEVHNFVIFFSFLQRRENNNLFEKKYSSKLKSIEKPYTKNIYFFKFINVPL